MNPLSITPDSLPVMIARLTPRQLEIIELLAQGHTTKDIGGMLSIDGETVKRHIYRACDRLELENRIQLVVIFTMWKVTNE